MPYQAIFRGQRTAANSDRARVGVGRAASDRRVESQLGDRFHFRIDSTTKRITVGNKFGSCDANAITRRDSRLMNSGRGNCQRSFFSCDIKDETACLQMIIVVIMAAFRRLRLAPYRADLDPSIARARDLGGLPSLFLDVSLDYL